MYPTTISYFCYTTHYTAHITPAARYSSSIPTSHQHGNIFHYYSNSSSGSVCHFVGGARQICVGGMQKRGRRHPTEIRQTPKQIRRFARSRQTKSQNLRSAQARTTTFKSLLLLLYLIPLTYALCLRANFRIFRYTGLTQHTGLLSCDHGPRTAFYYWCTAVSTASQQ